MSDHNGEPQLQPPTILSNNQDQEQETVDNNVCPQHQEKEEEEGKDADEKTSQTTVRCQCCSMRQKRMGLLFFSVLYVPLFAGAFFGFGPMQVLLENNGAFSSECGDNFLMNATAAENDDDDVCADQTAKLLTVPFVGQLMILTSPLVGALADHFGPMTTMSFQIIIECIGLVSLLLAVTIPVDNLLYVFSICSGLMTNAASILTVKTGMLFADDTTHFPSAQDDSYPVVEDEEKSNNPRQHQNQSRVISILNALFDAGSITYLGLWGISKLGVSLPAIVGMYLGLAVFCLGGAAIFWFLLGDMAEAKTTAISDEDPTSVINDGGEKEAAPPELDDAQQPKVESGTGETSLALTPAPSTTSAPSDNLNSGLSPARHSVTYICVADRPPRKQLLSLPFVMLLIFFALNLARNMFVLTTARDFIRYLSDGDKESAELYLTIFTLLMPASLIGLPFSDQVIARFGFHTGFQIVCLLGIVHGIIQISCDQLNGVQIFGFLVFSFFRCFLFSIVFSYLPTLLSPNVVGKGVGALHMAGGALAFLNIPLSNVAVKHLDGNFFVPNLIYTVLSIPCAGAAWFIGQTIQKEASAKGEKR